MKEKNKLKNCLLPKKSKGWLKINIISTNLMFNKQFKIIELIVDIIVEILNKNSLQLYKEVLFNH